MQSVIGDTDFPILLVTALAADASVAAVDAHSLARGTPVAGDLLRVPRRMNAAGVVFGWRASETPNHPSPHDLAIASALTESARAAGIESVSYVLFDADSTQPALRKVS